MAFSRKDESDYAAVLAREGIELRAPLTDEYREVLTPEAWRFVAELTRTFDARRRELLVRRAERQRQIDAGILPDFLEETKQVRESEWEVAAIPADLTDRRVEITGPVDRKMIINALNSGARVYMADFEDSCSPTWDNLVQGQLNLRDAVERTITWVSPEGKRYALASKTATLMVRPRGWHLPEKHAWLDGAPIPGALFDFGLYFFHNAARLRERGTGPYFYLPKLESHLEARLWNDVFRFAQDRLDLPRGTIRATVLIETLPAAFEMHEILWELREHSAGLNCGRWDYIFSFIKTFKEHAGYMLPDRGQLTMDRDFLKSYVELLIQTCHRRGVHAMGGMAAFIPRKDDAPANEQALAAVRRDKLREVQAGHDGTWVAHPGLVPLATEVFDAHMPTPNQIRRTPRQDVRVCAEDLLRVPEGKITEEGLRHNVRVGLQYLEAWLGGQGSVPLYHLMEDAATAEICRTQLWQWVRHRARLDTGRAVTAELVHQISGEELHRIREQVGPSRFELGRYGEAAELFAQMTTDRGLPLFLTLVAYDRLG